MSRQPRSIAKERTAAHPSIRGLAACFTRGNFFSATERSFYEVLRRLAPNHTVFAKVRLADLVSVRPTIERENLSKIDRKHIDFVVCDKDLAPVVAIKFDNASQPRSSRRARDRFVEEVLAAVALPVIHLGRQRGYAMDEIHGLIAPYLRIGTPFV